MHPDGMEDSGDPTRNRTGGVGWAGWLLLILLVQERPGLGERLAEDTQEEDWKEGMEHSLIEGVD